jgi:hypothetical protein
VRDPPQCLRFSSRARGSRARRGVYTMLDDEMHAVFVAFVVHARKRTASIRQSTIVRCATRRDPSGRIHSRTRPRPLGLIRTWGKISGRICEEETKGDAEAVQPGVRPSVAALHSAACCETTSFLATLHRAHYRLLGLRFPARRTEPLAPSLGHPLRGDSRYAVRACSGT